MKKLMIWNGRGNVPGTHLYLAAESAEDALRMLTECFGGRGWRNELKVYFAKGCWGNAMAKVEVERGIWVTRDASDVRPKRVWPRGK